MREAKMFGKDVIILEEGEFGVIWVEKAMLFKPCEGVFEDVKADPKHPLRGKTMLQAILEDVEDKMGWRKYVADLRKLLSK